jgi:hypothetical protein
VLDLWRIAFGKELDADIWRWKYADNPFGMRVLLCFDPDDEKAVVMYSGAPYRARWRDREVEIVQLMDIMSHPDFRKTGLFVKAAEVYFDTFAGGDSVLYYGIPGRYHFDIGAKYLKYSELASGVAYLAADPRKLARGPVGGSLRVSDRPAPVFDRMWRDLGEHYPLAAVRDRAFLEWRFFNHPRREYIVYVVGGGLLSRPRGYAVVGMDGTTARLVDLLVPPDRRPVSVLSSGLAADLVRRGIERVETWLPGGHFLTGLLELEGWGREDEPLGIVPTARSFNSALEIPWISDNFFYTMADSDLM